jgi:hypothetical protein
MPTELRTADRERAVARTSLIAALILAAGLQGVLAFRSMLIAKDGVHFIGIARSLRDAPRAVMAEEDQHPGFPALLLGAHYLVAPFLKDPTFSWIAAARIVGGITGLLTLLLVWRISDRLLGGYAAAMAAFIFAVQPMFRENAVDAMSDTPHLFFYMLGVWMACEGLLRGRWRWFPAAGASSALAYWIRPEGIGVAVVTTGMLAVFMLFRKGRRIYYLTGAGATLAAAVLIMSPYVAVKGSLTSKKQIRPEIFQSLSAVPPAVASRRPNEGRIVCASVGWLAALGKPELVALRCAEGFRYILLLPLAVGLFAGGRRVPRDPARFLLALAGVHLVLLLTLSALAGYVSARHTMPIVAVAMPWIGLGSWRVLAWVGRWVPGRERAAKALGHTGSVLLAGLVVVAPMTPRAARPLHRGHVAFARIGLELRLRASPGDRVLSNSPYVGFFADLESNYQRDIRLPQVVENPRLALPYRFIVIDRRADSFSERWIDTLRATHAQVPLPEKGLSSRQVTLMARRPGLGDENADGAH